MFKLIHQRAPILPMLGVLLLGQAGLGACLEGAAWPWPSLLALALLLGPGLAAALSSPGGMRLEGWLLCLAASFGSSTLALALGIRLGGFGWDVVLPILGGLTLVGWLSGRRGWLRWAEQEIPGSGWGLLGCCLFSIALVFTPFSRIGRLLPGGFAYRTYFDHDLWVHLAVIAELGKGVFPPRNPYFSGETLHYYWLYFLYPALAQKLAGGWATGANALILCNLAPILLFTGLLYAFLLRLARVAWLAALGCILAIFCGSFDGAYVLWRVAHRMLPASTGDYNVDAVSRWIFAAPQIDALYRGLLYTHQHLQAMSSLLALALALGRRQERGVWLWIALLLLALPGLSGFIGVIAGLWTLCVLGLDLTDKLGLRPKPRQGPEAPGPPDFSLKKRFLGFQRALGPLAGVGGAHLAAACLSLLLGFKLCTLLGMFSSQGGFVTVLAHPRTWQNLGVLLGLNFGALLPLGLLGLSLGLRAERRWGLLFSGLAFALTWHGARGGFLQTRPLLFLLGLGSAWAMLLLSVRDRTSGARDLLCLLGLALCAIFSGYIPGYVQEFGLRGGFVTALALGGLTALGWSAAREWSRLGRCLLFALSLGLALAALPTTWIDWKNSINLDDPRFVTFISPREAEALDWIRGNLPPLAVVQSAPNPVQKGRAGNIGNVINVFGQRIMACGKTYYAGQFEVGEERAKERAAQATRIFRDPDPLVRLESLVQLGVEFVWVGPAERELPRSEPGFFDAEPGIFSKIFDNQEISVYRVNLEEARRRLPGSP